MAPIPVKIYGSNKKSYWTNNSHDVVEGGPFAQVCTDLLAEGFVIS
jgi:hypothetical protein